MSEYKGNRLKLVDIYHPMLSTKLENFDFSNPPTDPIQLAYDLVETMKQEKGMGLSANQCGLPYRVFCMESNPVLICFNPRVVDFSSEEVELDEGCLSFNNLWLKIKRPKHIKVRYTEPNGNVVTKKFTGMTARCFLHEMDHMEGIKFIERVGKVQLEMAKKRQKKIQHYLRKIK
jgi:peptide deformylase